MSISAARLNDAVNHGGAVTSGSGTVYTNCCSAAAAGLSAASCSCHGGSSVASGSATVFVNCCSAARLGDATGCGAAISSGSGNVFIGG